MRVSDKWKDYELIDCSGGDRLERWADMILIRPDPQVIWNTERKNEYWRKAHAEYMRSNTGGGSWHIYRSVPGSWKISYGDFKFNVKTMGFKHTGIFPEQATNWELTSELIKNAGRQIKVLNLFGYTGCATTAALAAGAEVVHVDASKGMVTWARENAVLNGLEYKPVRWIVDDCIKFVAREIRRGNKYDIIIMDPPSYGRGPNGEVWKLEDKIYEFVESCTQILSDSPVMVMINSYTTGLSPSVMSYILEKTVGKKFGGSVTGDELGLPVTDSGLVLPCGATSIWRN
ncbi:MAG: class I SAM-dependent methyltransferase [Clostridiales bacterium]|nr:class I SAM-dependent methyltransferase [Clostridiales bacterium]